MNLKHNKPCLGWGLGKAPKNKTLNFFKYLIVEKVKYPIHQSPSQGCGLLADYAIAG
jgi:hypothetical protein